MIPHCLLSETSTNTNLQARSRALYIFTLKRYDINIGSDFTLFEFLDFLFFSFKCISLRESPSGEFARFATKGESSRITPLSFAFVYLFVGKGKKLADLFIYCYFRRHCLQIKQDVKNSDLVDHPMN